MDYTKLGSRMSGNVMQDPLQLTDQDKLNMLMGGQGPNYHLPEAPHPDTVTGMPLNVQQVEQYAQPAMDRYKQQAIIQMLQQGAPPQAPQPVPAQQPAQPPLPMRKPFNGM